MNIESILPIPDIFTAQRVLCVQPHYDDNDIGAGGTLVLLQKAGVVIIYLTVTDDRMGVVDSSMSDEAAAEALLHDQLTAGEITGVKEQLWLGYPDAGKYDHLTLRRDILKIIRTLKPDVVFTPDPWLTYEAHRDHIQTGLAVAEAVIFAGLSRISSGDPQVDTAYGKHNIQAVAFYYSREPNTIMDISPVWEEKLTAVRCYKTQFDPPGFEELALALDLKSRQYAIEKPFEHGEALKILPPSALHCGL